MTSSAKSVEVADKLVGISKEQQSMADDSLNCQTDELLNLIRELSTTRQSLLDLEAIGLQQAGPLHATYLQSARNLFHYLALRRHEMRPIQGRLSALG